MLKVLNVVGTRPEAVKMAPVVKALARHPTRVQSFLAITGQHRNLVDPILGFFNLVPDFDLDVMRVGQSLSGLTASLFEGLGRVIAETQPDWVLAQGDTTTVFVAATAAFYHRVHFGHIEAGLRTGDLARPFPEEFNRRVADLVANAHFAPTERARQALLREGIPASRVAVTGNTVVDALLDAAARPYDWSSGPLALLPRNARLVVVTAHRRESLGPPLREICLALRELALATERDNVHVVFPVHPNPSVRETVREVFADGASNVHRLEPLDYPDMVQLLCRATVVLTDSGGLQEEAPALGVPVLVLRETTERPEGVEAGVSQLVGTNCARIVAAALRLLRDDEARAAMIKPGCPYGDGKAAGRVVDHLLNSIPLR